MVSGNLIHWRTMVVIRGKLLSGLDYSMSWFTYMPRVVQLLHLALMHDNDVSCCPTGINTWHDEASTAQVLSFLLLGYDLRILVMACNQIRRLALTPSGVGVCHRMTLPAVIRMIYLVSLHVVRSRAPSVTPFYTYLILNYGGRGTQGALASPSIWGHRGIMNAGRCGCDCIRIYSSMIRLRDTHIHTTIP